MSILDNLDHFEAIDALTKADAVLMDLAATGTLSDEGALTARIAIKRRYLHYYTTEFFDHDQGIAEIVRELFDIEQSLAALKEWQFAREDLKSAPDAERLLAALTT